MVHVEDEAAAACTSTSPKPRCSVPAPAPPPPEEEVVLLVSISPRPHRPVPSTVNKKGSKFWGRFQATPLGERKVLVDSEFQCYT